jgi:hypothetical protein
MSATAILGLVSGKTFTDQNFHNRNNRRRIFHDYPVGQFPLTGLLSLMETEETDSFDFGWWEKRFKTVSTTAVAAAGALTLPLGNATGAANLASPAPIVAGTLYTVAVADTKDFLLRNVIWLKDLPISNTAYTQIKGVVTGIPTPGAPGVIQFQASVDTATALNTTNLINGATKGPVGAQVSVIGNANQEGASSGSGRLYTPSYASNYTQIFRNAFNFTRTALKVPTTFDKTGIYRETAEDNLRAHMTEQEKAFLFGTKRVDNVSDPITGDITPRRQTGGIIWFLEQWEAANSEYRGGAGAPAITSNSQDEKRIINIGEGGTAGTVAWSELNRYLERAFRCTNNKSFEKIFMCGSGFLATINTVFEQRAQLNKDFVVQKVYGMNVCTWETPFGTVHFKTHPLFSQDPTLRNDGLLLDVQNLKFRALNDSDTTLLPNRQPRDYDGRKDEWLTEAGLEVNFPESHMYLKNLQVITPNA